MFNRVFRKMRDISNKKPLKYEGHSPTYLSQEAMASNFAIVTSTWEHGIQAQYGTPVSMTYLTLHVPSAETYPKVKMIQFECESHDQGSTDYSYSWGDL